MRIQDLGTMKYGDAWAVQEQAHADVLAGGEERILLVEHPAVITLGRRPGLEPHVLADAERLGKLGVEVVHSDRGGEVTFHGPGQLVVYPIVRLSDHRLSVSGYVHALEEAIIAALADFGIAAKKDCAGIGVWIDNGGKPAKICAIGVRIRRGVSLHGVALNVETDLSFFDLIVPCGMPDKPATSMRKILGERTPTMAAVKAAVVHRLSERLAGV
jgi:lipoyl(octanoyl) transferase